MTVTDREVQRPALGELVLDLRGVTAGYGHVSVLHGVDLAVGAGEVVALLGANGAGKTTLLLTVSGLVPLTSGTIEVLGEAVPRRARAGGSSVWRRARSGVAHVPEDRGLFADLTAAENLRLGRRGRGAADDEEVVSWFPALGRVLHRRAGLLSGGEQQMLAVARALVGRPRLLLVDEMSLGLAPLVVEQLLPALHDVATASGAGVLLVEQHVSMALEVADRAYLLRRGRVEHAGSAAELDGDAQALEAGYLGEQPGEHT